MRSCVIAASIEAGELQMVDLRLATNWRGLGRHPYRRWRGGLRPAVRLMMGTWPHDTAAPRRVTLSVGQSPDVGAAGFVVALSVISQSSSAKVK
jgi:hypothetical protein